MACYDVYDLIAAKWHRAPSPMPVQEFLDMVASDGAAKTALLAIVDTSRAAEPQEPVHRRLKREAENGWYKGDEHMQVASRARLGAGKPTGAAAVPPAVDVPAPTAVAPGTASSNALAHEATRRRPADQPIVSVGAGLDAAAIEAIVKQAVSEEVGSLRVRVGQLEEEVLALRKQLPSAPSPPR